MRPPRPRLTIRTLMIAVALVGLTIFGSITAQRMSRRASTYELRASFWRSVQLDQGKHLALCRKKVADLVRSTSGLRARRRDFHPLQAEQLAKQFADETVWWQANAAHTEEMLTYSSMMTRKYRDAARYPWLTVPADRPAPYWSGVTDSRSAELAK
jgi:hypothetical protein